MPKGSLIPRDVKKKVGMLEKFMPQDLVNQFKILSEAERSFVIPVKIEENGEIRYLIIAGMLLHDKVPVSVSYDEEDLELLRYALEKAEMALAKTKNQDQETQSPEQKTDGEA
jgi:hypothetical protein